MTNFIELGILLEPILALVKMGSNKIIKLMKDGVLMIVYNYAKVST